MTSTFIAAVSTERARQISDEGRSAALDDTYTNGQLAAAAAAYAALAGNKPLSVVLMLWPSDWDRAWLKYDRADPARSMIKAGALMAAEADRLTRLAAREASA